MPVLYRARDDREWRRGWAENMSKTGLVVRADTAWSPDTAIEVLIDIPAHLATPFAGRTICRGRIVRTEGSSGLHARPAFAATIVEYETSHGADPARHLNL